MNPAFLDRIERTNLLLGVVAVVASGVLWGQVSAMLAAGAGAVLGSVNFWVVRRLGDRPPNRAARSGRMRWTAGWRRLASRATTRSNPAATGGTGDNRRDGPRPGPTRLRRIAVPDATAILDGWAIRV